MCSGFSVPPIELPVARLVALEPEACAGLAASIASIPPWSDIGYPAEALARSLGSADGAARYRIEAAGVTAGAVSVRHPWLKGPYLELLAILPPHQGQGIGSFVLDWFEREALRHGARNLWVCASSFNGRALDFYQRHGFRAAATLPGLVANGYDEILMRKFPLG